MPQLSFLALITVHRTLPPPTTWLRTSPMHAEEAHNRKGRHVGTRMARGSEVDHGGFIMRITSWLWGERKKKGRRGRLDANNVVGG